MFLIIWIPAFLGLVLFIAGKVVNAIGKKNLAIFFTFISLVLFVGQFILIGQIKPKVVATYQGTVLRQSESGNKFVVQFDKTGKKFEVENQNDNAVYDKHDEVTVKQEYSILNGTTYVMGDCICKISI